MEKKQKINCTVSSCRYNNEDNKTCKLDSIVITPTNGTNTKESDESMCSSYDYE